MTEPCMCNDRGHYQGSYSERKECGVIGAYGNDKVYCPPTTFKVSERAARKGRNPKTGEEIQIAASKVPAFKAGKGLKEAVNANAG